MNADLEATGRAVPRAGWQSASRRRGPPRVEPCICCSRFPFAPMLLLSRSLLSNLLKLARFSDRVSLCLSSASLTLSHQELEAQRSTHAPVQTWSPQHVGDWLREIGLGQHSATFEQNAIGGPELLSINPETLDKTLRVARPLHRKKIMTRLSLIMGDTPADPVT